jgi:hypothetical protein
MKKIKLPCGHEVDDNFLYEIVCPPCRKTYQRAGLSLPLVEKKGENPRLQVRS